MENNQYPKRPKRQAARKKKITTDRVDLFAASYVRNKYPAIYKEAVLFHDKLRRCDPEKLDLRKSTSYRVWIKEQNIFHGQFNNFQLKIHLMDDDNLQAKPQSEAVETIENIETLAEGDVEVELPVETIETQAVGEAESIVEIAVRETLDDNIHLSTLETPIQDNLYDEILKELREDGDIARIMRDIEDDMLFDEY